MLPQELTEISQGKEAPGVSQDEFTTFHYRHVGNCKAPSWLRSLV